MITDVMIVGRLSDMLNETTRVVEIDRMIPEHGKFVVDKIPVSYWSMEPHSRFMKLNSGILVVIRGRIQSESKFGIIIVAEQLAILGPNVLNEVGG